MWDAKPSFNPATPIYCAALRILFNPSFHFLVPEKRNCLFRLFNTVLKNDQKTMSLKAFSASKAICNSAILLFSFIPPYPSKAITYYDIHIQYVPKEGQLNSLLRTPEPGGLPKVS